MAILGIAIGLFVAIDNAICIRMLPNRDKRRQGPGDHQSRFPHCPSPFVPFIAPFLLHLGGFSML